MRVGGVQKCSFVDYPGKLAAVVFTPGCNLRCFYCHNPALLQAADCRTEIPLAAALAFLESRRGLLDAVVITGGEPTLQADLETFIRRVRRMGFAVKLDTNGTRPDVLKSLLDKNLLDFVAMDVKAPLHRYEEICGRGVDLDAIRTSIDILLSCEIDTEFRTTFAPQLSAADIVMIAGRIRGARRYALQQYRVPAASDFTPDTQDFPAPLPDAALREAARLAEPFVQTCLIRGIGKTDYPTPVAAPSVPQSTRAAVSA